MTEHPHRYAASHHDQVDASQGELQTRSRREATTCKHRLVHMAASEAHEDSKVVTESTADLIEHLEEHSTRWVAKFAAKVNGHDGGLSQKFIFHTSNVAHDKEATALAILEKYGR